MILLAATCLMLGSWLLWKAWQGISADPPESPRPYDWSADYGLMNVWAGEEMGELVAVYPQQEEKA